MTELQIPPIRVLRNAKTEHETNFAPDALGLDFVNVKPFRVRLQQASFQERQVAPHVGSLQSALRLYKEHYFYIRGLIQKNEVLRDSDGTKSNTKIHYPGTSTSIAATVFPSSFSRM